MHRRFSRLRTRTVLVAVVVGLASGLALGQRGLGSGGRAAGGGLGAGSTGGAAGTGTAAGAGASFGLPSPAGLPSTQPFPAGLPSPMPFPAGIPSSTIAPPGTVTPGSTTTGTTTDAGSIGGMSTTRGVVIIPMPVTAIDAGTMALSASPDAPSVSPNGAGQLLRGTLTPVQVELLFRQADVDADGLLTRAEALRLGVVAMAFDEMDTNHDGVVSRSEYEASLR